MTINVWNYCWIRDVDIYQADQILLNQTWVIKFKLMSTKILTSIENEILRGIDFVSVSGFASCHTVAGTKRSYYNGMKSRSFVSILRTAIRCKDKAYLALIEQSTAAISLLPMLDLWRNFDMPIVYNGRWTSNRMDCHASEWIVWIVMQVYECIFSKVKGDDVYY